ncbi:MAG TPA: biopolymer transporter ExbD [Pyrinomonadaceae bacterium]|jgi:biopolymer transport protein ExbD|nr:biopolymer transporter ExbD [Pyrinomonadaceae bacterium]
MKRIKDSTPPPFINVTPLIDVLLVLLIIFMVAVPLNPARFMAKLPSPPDNTQDLKPNDYTLVVTIEPDRTLKLNRDADMGTLDDMSKLTSRLVSVFDQRTRNRAYRADMMNRFDLPDDIRIEKTVFIKAPRTLAYGEVARVMDGLKGTGASPIGLQLDDLK